MVDSWLQTPAGPFPTEFQMPRKWQLCGSRDAESPQQPALTDWLFQALSQVQTRNMSIVHVMSHLKQKMCVVPDYTEVLWK